MTKTSVHDNRHSQLMRACDARLRRPQRLSRLSIAEEKVRWQNTLIGFDRVLWEAMQEEEVDQKVVDPEDFVRNNEELVVCHCDQIPMWLRMGSSRQLYKAGELRKEGRKRQELVEAGEIQKKGDETGGQVQECHAEDGMTQMRQDADGAADRFRVTLEVSQMVHHQLKLSEEPLVRHGRPVLVLPGCHARLSNISEDGTWIEDEVFKAKGKHVVRKQGQPVGNIMKSWRSMMSSGDPEVLAWLSEVEVMQQPAGYCDGIIVAWIQQMRYHEGYTRLITVRDLFAGALSDTAGRSSVLCSSLRAWIAGKMAAVMQITDTSVAFSLKRHVEAVKAEVRRAKRGEADWDTVFGEAGRGGAEVWGEGSPADNCSGLGSVEA